MTRALFSTDTKLENQERMFPLEMKSSLPSEALFLRCQTDEILRSKAKDLGKSFYHYTQAQTVKKILQADSIGNHFFFVRNISGMNDLNEAKLHEKNGNKIHSFCTCCSKHEKIPLWYLYSGICGNGARLGFSPGRMLRFLQSISVVYPVENGQVNYALPLHKGEDFQLHCGWVYYLLDGNNRVAYRNKTYAIPPVDKDVLQKCFFVKDYPWEYEQEFRIVIQNKTAHVYDQIAIPIPEDIISKLEIMSAPEQPFTSKEKEEFEALGIRPDKIKESTLGIHMNLLRNNRESILDQLDQWCEADRCDRICTYIRSKKKCVPQR